MDKTTVSTTDAPALRKALITSYASPALSAETQLRINDKIGKFGFLEKIFFQN